MPKRICFVTGTRAEFGLMRSALNAIQSHRRLQLQIIATGMHVDRSRGDTLRTIRNDGWKIDAVVPWKRTQLPADLAGETGRAMSGIAAALDRLKTDIVLVVGDRVEAFAGAAAGGIGGRIVAHVHGGDRALGQVDDSLRHAITKLAHIHFPATKESAARISRLGEDAWRIHCVGSPGIDGIAESAATSEEVAAFCPGLVKRRYALLVLHPVDQNLEVEERRAKAILAATLKSGVERVVIIYPNNDPGAGGIVRAWKAAVSDNRCVIYANVARSIFLGLLRDAAVLVGNSSSGIIEAASFGTPVIDIGPRQLGRECNAGVIHTNYEPAAITTAVAAIWRDARPRRERGRNVYDGRNAGEKIAHILSKSTGNPDFRKKLIIY